MGKIFDALAKTSGSISDPALLSASAPPTAREPVSDRSDAGLKTPVISPLERKSMEGAAPATEAVTSGFRLTPLAPSTSPEVLQTPIAAKTAGPVADHAILELSRARTLAIRIPSGDPMLPFDANPSRASEQYRYLRTKLIQHPKHPRSIMISSPGSGDGKSVTAVNLAGVLSLKGAAAVVLVDGDLRRASLHQHLGLPKDPGLADVLQGTCELQDALIHTEQLPNLFLIPAGECKANPAELLDSPAWSAITEKLRKVFRYVVVDSPPVGSVADFHLLEATCEGVVLVMRPDHTSRAMAMKALDMVSKEKSLGVVLNCVEEWSLVKHSQYDYSYAYLG